MWVPTQEKDNNSSSSDRVDAFNIEEQRQPRETALLFPLISGPLQEGAAHFRGE